MQFFIALLILFSTTMSYAKITPEVKKALASSVQVEIVDQGVGSGFAFARDTKRGKTLIITADHVCQQSRGTLPNKKYSVSPLNTFPIQIIDTKRNIYKGRVVFTTNVTLQHTEMYLLSKPDLCIVEINEVLPLVEISTDFIETGSEVFSVSGPNGTFPLVHKGYAGDLQATKNNLVLQLFSLNVTVGSSGGAIFEDGKVVGVIAAIEPINDDTLISVATISVPSRYIIQLYAQYRVYLLKRATK